MEPKTTSAAAKPALATIIKDYRDYKLMEELHGNWANVVFHRWPSFLVVWASARLGITPMAISLASAVVAFATPVAALALPLQTAMILVCMAGFLFQVLDCADGSLARTTGQVSSLGGTVDFLIDMAQWGLLYAALGILADRTLGTGGLWSALAVFAGWMRLYARMARDALAAESAPAKPGDSRGEGVSKAETKGLSPAGIVVAFVAGLSGLIPFLALAMPFPDLARASVGFLIAYSMLDVTDTAVSGWASLSRRGRTSA